MYCSQYSLIFNEDSSDGESVGGVPVHLQTPPSTSKSTSNSPQNPLAPSQAVIPPRLLQILPGTKPCQQGPSSHQAQSSAHHLFTPTRKGYYPAPVSKLGMEVPAKSPEDRKARDDRTTVIENLLGSLRCDMVCRFPPIIMLRGLTMSSAMSSQVRLISLRNCCFIYIYIGAPEVGAVLRAYKRIISVSLLVSAFETALGSRTLTKENSLLIC